MVGRLALYYAIMPGIDSF